MISYGEALKIITEEFKQIIPAVEEVDLLDTAGRTSAEDIIADINLPPFNNSAVDGYAIKFNQSIKEWNVIGEIAAGGFNQFLVDENSAVRIMTGGKMPEGYDTSIPIEDVTLADTTIKLNEGSRFAKGLNVRILGEDLSEGQVAVSKNTLIKPHQIAVAASCGYSKIKVKKKLNIGVVTTGNELVPVEEKPTGDKIRSSNLYSLLAAVKESGMNPVNFGTIKDEKELVTKKISEAFESEIDILVSTGGVSVGKYDFVKEVYEQLGVETKFWRVYIKPGKPTYFGVLHKTDKRILVFGLPGNPVSSLVNYIIFIKNNIDKLYNKVSSLPVFAELKYQIKKRDKKRHFIRGLFSAHNGNYFVEKAGSQSSGNLAHMGRSNCLIIFKEEKMELNEGEIVECIPI